VIGRTLPVGRSILRIAGVLAPGFGGPLRGIRSDLFVPQQAMFGSMQMSNPDNPRDTDFEVLGRLRLGVQPEQARTEVGAILRQVAAEGRAPAPGRNPLTEDFTERNLGGFVTSWSPSRSSRAPLCALTDSNARSKITEMSSVNGWCSDNSRPARSTASSGPDCRTSVCSGRTPFGLQVTGSGGRAAVARGFEGVLAASLKSTSGSNTMKRLPAAMRSPG
jgi:hypothetical protein